ncbi:MAG: hypothetical protein KC656_31085, partial [Myxococcales bacterium]|nr:hypothetical protein [Myxococcales bacterium]
TTGFRRPRGLPTVAQRLDSTGTPTWTAYVGPREPLVPYEAVPRTRNAFLACAAGALVAGSAVSGLAWSTRQSLPRKARDPAVTAESLDAGRARANGLQLVGLGAFVGAGACGAGAWVWR